MNTTKSQEVGAVDPVIVKRIPLHNVQFTDTGMFVRSGIPVETAYGEHRDNGKGWFVQVDRFAWIERRSPSIVSIPVAEIGTSATGDIQNDRPAEASTDAQAMDVDEAPVVVKSEGDIPANGISSPAAMRNELGSQTEDEVPPANLAETANVPSGEEPGLSEAAIVSGNGFSAELTSAIPTPRPVGDSATPHIVGDSATSATLPVSLSGETAPGPTPGVEIQKEMPTSGDGEVKDEPMEDPGPPARADQPVLDQGEVKAETQ